MSKQNVLLKKVSKKGYSVSKDGKTITSFTGKVLKPRVMNRGKGYFCFGVRDDDIPSRPVLVHRLQAYQKFGEKIFEKGIQVRHLDGNSMNNSWENIAIGTQSENSMDRPRDERIRNASNPIYNHSDIIEDWTNGMSYSKIMKKYDISSKGTVSFIINKSLESQK